MTNILIEYDRVIPTVSMTVAFFNRFAEVHGSMVIRSKDSRSIRKTDIEWCDILISIRGNSCLSRDIMRQARACGCFCILMADDNLAELPDNFVIHPRRPKWFVQVAQNAHVILSDNDLLASRIQELSGCARTARIDTPIRSEEMLELDKQSDHADQEIKVVYAAGVDHAETFDCIVAEPLREAIEEWGRPVSVTFVGVNPTANQLDSFCKVNRVAAMPFDQYRSFMKDSSFDIGLAPLSGDRFSEYKYFNKFVEYTLMGITGVYTDSEPFVEIVEQGYNGFLCKNNPDAWKRALTLAFEDISEKRLCIQGARDTALLKLSEDKIHNRLLQDIPELASYSKKGKCVCRDIEVTVARLKYNIFRIVEMPYLLASYMKAGQFARIRQSLKTKLGR